MTVFITYDDTGFIHHVGQCPDKEWPTYPPPDDGLKYGEIESFPEHPLEWLTAHYVVGDVMVERATITAMPSRGTVAANGTDEVIITGLPDPCVVSLAGRFSHAPTTVNGGEIIITANAPGSITVTVTAEPAYLKWSTIIHAV